jgi:nitric oxide reductase subunit B
MVVHAVYWHRAVGGSAWSAFFAAQVHAWFVQAMVWRNVFGFVMAFGLALLFWDVLTIGRGERRVAAFAPPRVDAILSTGL